jgi:hypothetical protein
MNNQALAGVVGASLTIGSVGGYFLGRKHAQLKYDTLMAEEIKQAREFYSKVYKKEDFDSPESAAEALGVSVDLTPATEALRRYQGQDLVESPHEKNPTVEELIEVSEHDGTIEKNIFEGSGIDQLAVDDRQPNIPYVITTEEFMENELDHNQITVTYYEGDKILADERDDIIEDINETVGRANLELFGLASGDPNVVHVRNEIRSLDFEITRSTGEYRREVAGFTDEDSLQHSDRRMRRQRPRWDE